MPHPELSRWPTLLACVTLTGTGLALDLADASSAPFAAGCLVLGAAAFGAFLYAEGARHREWTDDERARIADANTPPAGPTQHP